jgi:hypothetical protein
MAAVSPIGKTLIASCDVLHRAACRRSARARTHAPLRSPALTALLFRDQVPPHQRCRHRLSSVRVAEPNHLFCGKINCRLLPDGLIVVLTRICNRRGSWGRGHSTKNSFLSTTAAAALLASTSLVYAIDPNASVTIQNAKQGAAAKAQNMQQRITRMEDQIARMNKELIAMREQMRLHLLEQSAAR